MCRGQNTILSFVKYVLSNIDLIYKSLLKRKSQFSFLL